MRLITSERAKRDIEEIARYVALDSSQSAEELRKAFDNACELLLHTPEMDPIVVSIIQLSTISV